jgi:hypothetical protein
MVATAADENVQQVNWLGNIAQQDDLQVIVEATDVSTTIPPTLSYIGLYRLSS